jgi:tRNA threonylcarbamoyl adenosine modification protein YjeE
MKKVVINSKNEMINFAREIASSCHIGDVIALYGTLGAGKSFFAKNFISSLQNQECEILSPTFNLVYSYETKKGEISHFDLYRLKSAQELENIGFFDAIKNTISLIEWPEIAEDFLPKNHKKIIIKFLSNGAEEAREVVLND